MKFDLTSKKTDAEWTESIDKFWLEFVPHFFQLLEWLLIIGFLKYLSQEYEFVITKILLALSYIFLLFYISSGLYSIQFRLMKLKSPRLEYLVSLLISTLFILFYIKISENIIGVIAITQE